MKICDAHCDTLYRMALSGVPERECTVTPERLAEGGVAMQVFAVFAAADGGKNPYEKGVAMLDAAERLSVPIYTGALPEALDDAPHGVISIEGGEMLEGSLERFHEVYARARVRMIALTWNYENEIGHPAKNGPEGGLKPFGRALVKEMSRKGTLCDVSHLNEAGFWDVAELSELPPIASHSNLRELCDVPRNLRREQVKAIIERNGFIGINFYSEFLAQGRPATVDDVLRHIDEIAQMGGAGVLGFGSDFDGIDQWPDGLGNPADFPALIERLRGHGYPEATIEGIAGGNLFRVLKAAEQK